MDAVTVPPVRSVFSGLGLRRLVSRSLSPSLAQQLLPRWALPALLAPCPMVCWFRALVAFMPQALDLRVTPAVSHCRLR